MKKIFFVLCICITLSLNGCAFLETGEQRVERRRTQFTEKTLAYLNERYADFDDTFTVVAATGPVFLHPWWQSWVTSEKYNGQQFQVTMSKVDGEERYRDTYFSVYWQQEAGVFFEEIAKPYVEDIFFRVVFFNSHLPEGLDLSSTFTDYMNSGKTSMLVRAYIPGSIETVRAEYENFLKQLIEDGYEEELPILYALDPTEYQSCKEKTLDEINDLRVVSMWWEYSLNPDGTFNIL